MATKRWQKAAVHKALRALELAHAHPAGAGPEAVMQFRGHVLTIVSATPDSEVKRLAEHFIGCAEDLFVGPRPKPESHYRRCLFLAHEELRAALRELDLA